MCSALKRDGQGLGQVTVTDVHNITPHSSLMYGFGFGEGTLASINGHFSLTKYLFTSFRAHSKLYDDGELDYGTLRYCYLSLPLSLSLSLSLCLSICLSVRLSFFLLFSSSPSVKIYFIITMSISAY